jgi:hypothetical protein
MYLWKVKKLIPALLLIVSCFKAHSWSAKGHTIVASFAKENLKMIDKSIIDSVQYFLGEMSFEKASLWMDEIKGDSSYDHLKPAHYINVERDATYVKTKDINVVNEIEAALGILRKKGPRDKDKIAFALRELFHLIGDLHQPLHAGYAEDRGGNEIQVTYKKGSTNLHALWDGDIIQGENINLGSCLNFANAMNLKEKTAAQKIDAGEWMNESRALLPFVYSYTDGKISEQYSKDAKPIIERQLVKAGIRLTAVLYTYFRKKEQM